MTGCFNLRGNLEVGRDAKISGKLTGEINKQLAAMAGITSKDALVAQMDGKESIHHGNQNVELIDCCGITEFWQQQLLSTQDPITWAVEALSPIVQTREHIGIGRTSACDRCRPVALWPRARGGPNG